ncbi:MAG: CotH kinase family protein [Clostridia bacterium]|nr:CotH kinase family protein [Clostridia bacterium]
MKKILSVLLAILVLVPLAALLPAQAASSLNLSITPFASDCTEIKAWYNKKNLTYYLFFPAGCDLSAVKVSFTGSDTLKVDGQTLHNGDVTDVFASDETLTVKQNGRVYTLKCCQSASLPSVYIQTESGSLDYIHANKENKEKAVITTVEGGKVTLDGAALKQIKGRGNATWNHPKKPYNIKFDKKTKLLGMAKAKKWTLIANHGDPSLIHNDYGWLLAEAFGLPYTSDFRHVDLYINGEYLGNYVICESVEIGSSRIDINDLEDANEDANPDVDIESLPLQGTGANGAVQAGNVAGSRKWAQIPNDPDDITGGYLLEYEYGGRYNEEPCGFVTDNGQPVVIKSPEYASKAEVNYIADFVNAGTEALYSETGYNAEGKHYSDYFDVESLVNMYLLQELSMNFDAGFSSFFAYKPEGESKLVFAPVWDMDNAFGIRHQHLGVKLSSTDYWWANQMGKEGIPSVLSAAFAQPEIRTAAKARWTAMRDAGVFEAVNADMAALIDAIGTSAALNGVRWDHFGTTNVDATKAAWQDVAAQSTEFVAGRTAALHTGFGETGACLHYDLNGAFSDEWALVTPISQVGDTLAVRKITGNGDITLPQGRVFDGWNTKADGSGKTYHPGDRITLTEEYTVLYAQFREKNTVETFWQKIKDFFVKMWKAFISVFK